MLTLIFKRMKKFHLIIYFLIPVTLLAQTIDPQLEGARKKMEAKDFAGAKADLTKIIEANPKNKMHSRFAVGRAWH